MLKLIQWVIPVWAINWANLNYTVDKIIWAVQSIYVDGVLLDSSWFTFNEFQLTLVVAPTISIVTNIFYREVNAVRWNWEVTLWDLKDDFYRKVGRINLDGSVPLNISRLYPSDYVKSELVKSIKRYSNVSPKRTKIQQYSLSSKNWLTITDLTIDNIVTFEERITDDIEWLLMIDWGVTYEYYASTWTTFNTADINIWEVGDKLIVWYRIPYGVDKVTDLKVGWLTFDYIEETDFNMDVENKYTIIKDFQWNEYLFLPYSETARIHTVKYVPTAWIMSNDNDIIDIPSEYTDLFVYDTAYKLLRDKEDERWAWLKDEIGTGRKQGLLYEYQAYTKSSIDKPNYQIGFAKT